ncbi:MAG: hypothetical protein JSV17_13970 [Candidatus Aminicenantes bacterium]|nr:MAG: hypothetical protein JSV17_13970 [Candidatus Aminicenantes bacterium]
MRIKKCLRALGLVFILACVIVPLSIQADVYIKQKNHTDGFSMMGQSQPAQDDLFVTWMAKDKARMDHGEDSTIIIWMDKKVMYMIDHAEMRYTEMPIDSKGDIFSSAISASDLSDEEQAQAKKMMEGFAKMMKPKVSVKETGETQKIKNWDCKKYIMTMSMMGTTTKYETWATEDIKIDYELYRNLTFSVMGQTPGIEDMVKEMEKIKGIVVLSTGTMSMMGTDVKSSQELLEVSDKAAPGGTYEVPEGYKKEN